MNVKTISILAVALAVIAAAAVVVSLNRSDEARAEAEAAAAKADEATALARAEKARAEAEAQKARAAADEAKAKADALEQAKIARDEAGLRARAEADLRVRTEASAQAARATTEAEQAARQAEQARTDRAKAALDLTNAVAKIETAKAEAAAAVLETERLKAEKVLAEAKLLELRKIDFAAIEQNLLDWKADLDAREQALAPEKSIADLSWAGGAEDSVIDADGHLVKRQKRAYDPEKDRSLPCSSRRLARAERLARAAVSNDVGAVRASVLKTLEGLYVAALREDRVVDADYYRKAILSMYPDWTLPAKKAGESGKGGVPSARETYGL